MVELLDILDIPVISKGSWMMDVPVPNTPPFLITRTSSLHWRDGHRAGSIRTGFRKDGITRKDFYTEVIEEILRKSVECHWGNIASPTKGNLGLALNRMQEFDYSEEEVEILSARKPRFSCEYTPTTWMPSGTIAIVPKDRSYLGWVHDGPEGLASVIHNSARAICLLVSDAKLDRLATEELKPKHEVEGLSDGEGGE